MDARKRAAAANADAGFKRSRRVRSKGRSRPRIDRLEDRTLMAGPTINISDLTVIRGSAGPAIASGTLSPGTAAEGYRINGVAGEAISFHMTTQSPASSLNWDLYGADNQYINGANNGGDFTAYLPADGTYDLYLFGTNTTANVNYTLQATDVTDPATSTTGLDAPQSGTLNVGGSGTYQFSVTAGQTIYFDSRSTGGVYYTLTDPNNATVFNTVYNNDQGPLTLTRSGTYTLKYSYYTGGTAQPYAFDVESIPGSTTPLSLNTPTAGTVAGYNAVAYTFTGAPGQRISFVGELGTSPTVYARLYAPDGQQIESPNVDNGYFDPTTLTQAGRYTLVVDSEQSASANYQFEVDDGASQPATVNGTTSGTLPNGLAGHLYSFQATAGQQVFFQPLTPTAYGEAYYTIYRPDNGRQVSTPLYQGADQVFTAPATGTYLVWITGQNAANATVPYSFKLYESTTPTDALTLNAVTSGTSTTPGSVHQYTFTGAVGQAIWLDGQTPGLTGGTSNSQIYAKLTDPYGNGVFGYLDLAYDNGPYILTEAGTYTLSVAGNFGTGQTGAYSFNLRDMASGSTPLTVGAPTSGTLATGLSADFYSFSATAGQRIDVKGLADGHSSESYIYIYQPNFGYQTALYSDPNSDRQFTATQTGTYYVVVAGQNASNTSGNTYSFQVSESSVPTDALALDTVTTGTLAVPGAQHQYTFSGTAGEVVYLDGQTPGLSGGSSGSNILANLADSFGNYLIGYTTYGNDLAQDDGPIVLPRDGTYTLTVLGSGTTTGNYAFNLKTFAGAATLTPNAPTSGTLTPGNATDLYQFTATAGQRIDLRGLGDAHTNGAYVSLYSPTYGNLANAYANAGSDGQVTAKQTGTYYVAVSGQSSSNASDTYSIQVSTSTTPSDALALDTVTTGTLAVPGAQHQYTFSGTAGEVVYLDGQTPGLSGGSSGSNILARLADPFGVYVFGSSYYGNDLAADSGPFVLPRDGTYTLTVLGAGATDGSYSFNLRTFAGAAALTTNAVTSGTLATGNTADLYQFTANAGDHIAVQSLGDGHQYGAYYDLYDPQNNSVFSSYTDSNYGVQSVAVKATGTYVLVVRGLNASNANDTYSLDVTDTPTPTDALALNTPTPGNLPQPGAHHEYTFTGTPGQVIEFNGISSDTNIYSRLTDPYGSGVFGQYLTSDAGPYVLSQPGTYTLDVYGLGAADGNYNFQILSPAANPLTLPASHVTGTLNPGTEAAAYTIQGQAGQTLAIHSNTAALSGTMYLFDANNNYVTSTTLGNSFSTVLPSTGAYTLLIFGSGTPAQTYDFDAAVTDPGTATLSGFNALNTGTLAGAGSQTFNLSAPAGTVVYLDNQAGAGTSLVYTLTDPNNTNVFNTYLSQNDVGPIILTASGNYTLKVTNNAASSQSFAFDFLAAPTTANVTPGTVVAGTLGAQAATLLAFPAQAGQTFVYDGQTSTSNTVNTSIYSPTLAGLATINAGSDFGPTLLTQPLGGTGLDYLVVYNYGNNSQPYQFRVLDPASNPLTTNAVTSGTLASGLQTDAYTFTATAGDRLDVEPLLDSVSNAAYYRLYEPIGAQVLYGYTDNTPSYNSLLTATETGQYTLLVQGQTSQNSNVNYKLEVFQQSPVPTAALTLDAVTSGTIAQPGAAQNYTFNASQGQTLFFDGMESAAGLYAQLRDPNGNLTTLNGYATSQDSYNPYLVTVPGTYTLTVYSNSEATGNYAFAMRTAGAATTLATDGSTTTGTLATGLTAKLYTFSATAGQRLDITGLGDSPAFGAYYRLYRPDNSGFQNNYTDVNYNNLVTLDESGTWLLAVEGQSAANTSGVTYSLAATLTTTATDSLTLDAVTSGTLAKAGATHVYTFQGTVGQRLFVDGLESSPNIYLYITDPNGNSFLDYGGATTNDSNLATVTLPGTYTVTVASNSAATGNYAFAIRTAGAATTLATDGSTTTGTLATGLTAKLYTFSATAGQHLYIHGLSDSPQYGSYYYLYRPDNSQVRSAYTDLNYDTSINIDETGTWLLAVEGTNAANASGDTFSIAASLSSTTTSAMTLGAITTGTIPQPGGQENFTFTGAAGHRLVFDGLTTGYPFYATITDPYGTNIYSGYLSGYNDNILLKYNGTYTVNVAAQGNSSGSFAFELLDRAAATPISVNTPLTDTLTNGRTVKLYSFTATAGQQIFVQGLSDQTSGATYYQLIGPDGADVGIGQYTENNSGPLTLKESGTYVFAVGAQSFTNTSDTFSIEPFLSTTPADPLALNTTVTGTLPQPGSWHTYTFQGAVGQRLVFDGQSTASTIYAYLLDPEGNVVSGLYGMYLANDYAASHALSLAGTYTLYIEGSGTSTGAYSFQLLDGDTQPSLTFGAGEADFAVTLSAASATPVTVQYATADGTATANQDYRPVADGVLTIPAGATQATIPIELLNDGVIPQAGLETFTVTLSNPTGGTLANGQSTQAATATVVEGPVITINDQTVTAPATGTVTEEFTVSLSRPVNVQVQVNYATADDTATSPGDYQATSGTLTFAPNTTTQVIDVTVNAGSGTTSKDFRVNLSSPQYAVLGALVGQKSQGVGTIQYQVQAGSVSGTVYNDVNGNGTRDSGDNGLGGVSIQLYNGGTFVAGTTTASDGTYSLTGIQPGTYTLYEGTPGGYVETAPGSPGTYSVTITPGGTLTGKDFGLFQTVSVSGNVFNDLNGNGTQDGGEPGLQNWLVEVVNGSNNIVNYAYTDANGNYLIPGIGPGTFTVREVLQANFAQTAPAAPGTYTITTSSGTNITGETFGDYRNAAVSGTVFNDLNGNGNLDNGEPGLQNVTVNLVQGATVAYTTTTDANGNYAFGTVAPGSYTLEEVTPSGFVQTAPAAPGTYSLAITSGKAFPGENFGDFQQVTVSGNVFNDTNGDGIHQSGEPGVQNWTVQLVDGSNTVVGSATTDASGNYSIPDIGPGSFTLREVLQNGYVQTTPAGSYPITTSSGSNVSGENFGLFQEVSVSGNVFNDTNGDGIHQSGEPGVQNWTVQLVNGGNNVVGTATTDASGNYAIPNIGPGNFTVREMLQGGYVQTAPAGSYAITTSSGTNVSGENFGVFQTVTISGTVFNDANGDGVQDNGETGLQNWTVQVVDGSNQVVAQQPTDASGNYAIANIGPGSFTVREVLQTNYAQTAPTSGTYAITTSSGANVANENFGDYRFAAVSGNVFNDLNGNGARDGNEPGLQNVTVQLVQGTTVAYGTTTDANGNYSFGTVAPGSYTLRELTPTGYVQTAPASPGTYALTIAGGATFAGEDFGDFQQVTVSGNVFNDLNGNGTQDGGEPGLQGWMVQVVDGSNTVVGSATTDAGGNYSIPNIGPGSFTVREVLQGGYVQTAPTSGTYAITTNSGSNITGETFGDYLNAAVSGTVFNDLNGDGILGNAEPGLPNVTVNLVQGATVAYTTTTDANGNYAFGTVAPGSYTLEEVTPSGFVQTAPAAPGTYSLAITGGKAFPGENFGDFRRVSVSGNVFDDLNGNGARDGGEPGLQNWTVQVVDGSNTVVGSATTDAGGNYSIPDIGPGSFTLREVLQGGFTQTAPASPGTYAFTTSSGVNVVGGIFGDEAAPGVSVVSTLSPSTYGQAVSFTATVSPATGYATPGGQVQFVVDGTNFGAPVTLVNGQATSQSIDTLSAGNHTVVADYLGDGFYAQSSGHTTQVVNKATLTLVADDASMNHYDPLPNLTYHYAGFVLGENATTAGVGGTVTLTTSATSSSPAGYYPIQPSVANFSAANYTLGGTQDGTLTVKPKVMDVLVDFGSKSVSLIGLNRDLPFIDITGIDVKFSDNVSVSESMLLLTGTLGGTYPFSNFRYNSNTDDATWTLPTAIGVDRLMLSLGGESATPLFGTGPAIGADLFTNNFSVLPGDVNGDGVVTIADAVTVRNDQTAYGQTYILWNDVDGSGTIDSNDINAVRRRVGTHLP